MSKADSASAAVSGSRNASFWMAPWSAFGGGALIVGRLQRGSFLSRRHDLKHFLQDLARIATVRGGFAERLLHPVDDVALGLESFALGVELDVGLLQLRHGYAHLLLHCRQSLG